MTIRFSAPFYFVCGVFSSFAFAATRPDAVGYFLLAGLALIVALVFDANS